MKKSTIVALLILLASPSFSQDNRTMQTRVADLLARMPVYNLKGLTMQMDEMTSMGPEGRTMICDLVFPPGTGDDTGARFAIESYSRYVSEFGKTYEAGVWEEECIAAFRKSNDTGVKTFFMHQLEYFGGKISSDFAVGYLGDSQLCAPALAVIGAGKIRGYDKILAKELEKDNIPCAAGIMNILATWNPDLATDAIIELYSEGDINIKTAALRALGFSSGADALKLLKSAAANAGYTWEPTNATGALLTYAEKAGERGDLETLKNICAILLKRATVSQSIQYKIEALTVLVDFTGLESISILAEALGSPDTRYRLAALGIAKGIPGTVATRKYISLLESLPVIAQADLITMLGDRGDPIATEAILKHLFMSADQVRVQSAMALAKLEGKLAVPHLIDYLRSFPSIDDQRVGMIALATVADSNSRILISEAINDSPEITKANLISVLSIGGENKYFDQVVKYCSSEAPNLRLSAYESLPAIAGPANTELLISMLNLATDENEISLLQEALAQSIIRSENIEIAINPLLDALEITDNKEKIIPVLPMTGGKKALEALEKQFESGTAELRTECFKALAAWPDYDVIYTLFDILVSGNKTYEEPAFAGYVRLVSEASIPGEQKLLLLRKVMPWAVSINRKSMIIARLIGVRTFQSFIFLSGYLNDPDLGQLAARGLMNVGLPAASSPGLTGSIVKDILEQTALVISGEESAYYRERINEYIASMPDEEGFVPMFNGKDLTGWQGLVENPISRSKMNSRELAQKQKAADLEMMKNWTVRDGAIWFSGEGANLCSVKEYGDFEMIVDWRITKKGDSGIYLRGTPQVQIWDTSRVDVGAQVGSGGLYNNTLNVSKPLVVADNPVGDWNTFRIIMVGERVSVWLNGILVVDNVILENYWDRSIPIFPTGPIELQAHGNELAFRDIYVREIRREDIGLTPADRREGFVSLFNGNDLDNWTGNKSAYIVEDGMIVVKPGEGSGGNLYTQDQYANFIFRFEFQLTPGANNGLGIRAPLAGDAAYVGMELQIIDNDAPVYANLQPYQYHGSVYGVIPAKRGFLNPVGEWNSQEVIVNGTRITVILNGNVILDGDISDAIDNGTMDHNDHPGLKRESGHIGFLGHGSEVRFRNIRIKTL